MEDLSYYKKLGFKNAFSWSEKDFVGFLFSKELQEEGSLQASTMQGAKELMQGYNKYKIVLDLCARLFQKLCFKNHKGGKKILFHSIRFPELILEMKKQYPLGLIVWGQKDRLFSFKNSIGYISLNDLYQYIFRYMEEKNIDYLYKLVEKLEERLSALKPDYVVLWSDVFPIEKAIILACKKLGICTLAIQHGIILSPRFLTPIIERPVDYVLVWGQYVKDLYVQEKIKSPEEVYVLGYPYKINKSEPKSNKKYVVCYLGQDYETHKKEILDIKLKTIARLNEICKKLNVEFLYRPHPNDDRNLLESKASDIKFTSKNERIFDTIAKGDIFISFDSTSLIEAAMRDKLSLQLMNYPLPADNFEKLGICAKSFQDIEQLNRYLQEIARTSHLGEVKFEFNNHYIETRYNPGQRFIEILNQIGANSIQSKS